MSQADTNRAMQPSLPAKAWAVVFDVIDQSYKTKFPRAKTSSIYVKGDLFQFHIDYGSMTVTVKVFPDHQRLSDLQSRLDSLACDLAVATKRLPGGGKFSNANKQAQSEAVRATLKGEIHYIENEMKRIKEILEARPITRVLVYSYNCPEDEWFVALGAIEERIHSPIVKTTARIEASEAAARILGVEKKGRTEAEKKAWGERMKEAKEKKKNAAL